MITYSVEGGDLLLELLANTVGLLQIRKVALDPFNLGGITVVLQLGDGFIGVGLLV